MSKRAPSERPVSEPAISERPVSERPVSEPAVSERPVSEPAVSERPDSARSISDQVPSDRAFSVPPFARRCIDAAGDAWGASFEHPFVQSLADGSLDAERFRFYQMQDARYLEAFSDTACLIATRCLRPDDKLWFVDAAKMALEVEGELHAGYGEALGYGPEDIAALELTPNNRGSQNHMLERALRGSLVEAVAALTPCPWLYIDLGQHLMRQAGGHVAEDHPYAAWLRMYADPAFNDYMDHLLKRLQRFADAADEATRVRAIDAFVVSARYEYMFWDQAWALQPWPV